MPYCADRIYVQEAYEFCSIVLDAYIFTQLVIECGSQLFSDRQIYACIHACMWFYADNHMI